jgi:PPM family protein phosphatase
MSAHVTKVEYARKEGGEDRTAVVHLLDRDVFVVADGAGGTSGGAIAAEKVCEAIVATAGTGKNVSWAYMLSVSDRLISFSTEAGLAAVAVMEVWKDGRVTGASVGDCEIWIFDRDYQPKCLTANQVRKPLLGDGTAVPVGFAADAPRSTRTIVAATDGLWKYANLRRIEKIVTEEPLKTVVNMLVDAARLPNGRLQDDIAVTVCALGS